MSDLAVYVTSRDQANLDRLVPSIDAQGVKYQGYLQDNTDDGTLTAPDGWVRKWRGGNQPGYAHGLNAFLSEHRDFYGLLICSDDAILGDGTLRHMLAHDYPIVGTLIVDSTGNINHAGGGMAGLKVWHQGRNKAPSLAGPCRRVPWVTSAIAFYTAEVLAAVKWDEDYSYGFEDLDFCLTARELGFDSFVCTETFSFHDEHGTRDGSDDPRNATVYVNKWRNRIGVA